MVEALCRKYAVSLYPAGGFASVSFVYQAAEHASPAARDRPIDIIYIGDYDPAGTLIDPAIRSEFKRHLGGDLTLHRVAITKEQIALHDLPTKPRKESEQRCPDIDETVEAEAMPVELLLDLLRRKLDVFLRAGALEKAKQVESRVKRDLLDLADWIDESEDGLVDVIRSRYSVKIAQMNEKTDPGES